MNSCPACLSAKADVFLKTPKDFEYFTMRITEAVFLKCLSCGSIYQNPWPDEDEVSGFYPGDYQNYTRKDIPLLSVLLRFFVESATRSFIQKYGIEKRLLDFGCGDGTFLESLSKKGMFNIAGFEPHKRENTVVHEAGFSVFGSLDQLCNSGPFDIIRMNHVIEHLSSPDRTMNILKNLLAPGGCIIMQTPNPQGITLKLFKKFWGPLHYPYHTVLFTPEGMDASASRWGVTVDSVHGTSFPTGWSMSLENIIKKKITTTRRGRLPFYGLLVIGTLPLAVLEKIFFCSKTAVVDYILVHTS